jgi:hypothetical protein
VGIIDEIALWIKRTRGPKSPAKFAAERIKMKAAKGFEIQVMGV